MDEKFDMIDTNNDVDEQTVYEEENIVAEETEADDGNALKFIVGVGATVIMVAACAAYKKFGPTIKAKADEAKMNHLRKKEEKLANELLEVKAKLNQMETEGAEKE